AFSVGAHDEKGIQGADTAAENFEAWFEGRPAVLRKLDDFFEAQLADGFNDARGTVFLVQEGDAAAMRFGDFLQGREIEVAGVFMGEPDMLDAIERNFIGRAEESGAVVIDLAGGPGVAPDAGGTGFEKETGVIYERDSHCGLDVVLLVAE